MPENVQTPIDTNDVKLELSDAVVLRSDPCLIGTVLRTYHDFNSHEPLEDSLIIAHASVPTAAIQSFVLDGVPPRGYVYVEWAREEHGHSLVAESDLIFLHRPFRLGDTVKRITGDSPMVGTVVDVHDTYILEPIVQLRAGVLEFNEIGKSDSSEQIGQRSSSWGLPDGVTHPAPDQLLYNIPAEELKRADDFQAGDYVLRKDWIGVVEDSDLEVVLLLENNSLVVVQDPDELELVIPDLGHPLITLPDLDGIRRPDVVAANAGGLMSTPFHSLARGQFVITNHKNLRNGRWLHGAYQEGCRPQGHILDVRSSHVDVQWLCPNAFAPEEAGRMRPPSAVRPYENLSAYNIPSELRRNKSLVLFDHFRYPIRKQNNDDSRKPISAGQDLTSGDSVRFRDPTAAAVKYQGTTHGHFKRIPKGVTYGFDLNEFRIFAAHQDVVVQWQDQSTTTDHSNTLKPFSLPEAELCPGDIVTLKEGMKQIAVGKADEVAVEFNEMLYFQGNFRLRPQKVGVIQSVNSKERLARIRLFTKPTVELLEQGNVLRAGSKLGPISDVFEEVSLYEIMAHPALIRRRRDLVILPPENPTADVLQSLGGSRSSCPLGPSTLSYLRSLRPDSKFDHVRNVAKHFVQCDNNLPHTGVRQLASVVQNYRDTSRPLDWVGQIVDLGTDGLLTVRLGSLGSDCHDAKVPFERILMILDEDAELDDGSSIMSAEDPWSDYRSGSEYDTDSAIDEEVEYEGGERLDDDSDDEWMTDEEIDVRSPNVEQDVTMEDYLVVDDTNQHQDISNGDAPKDDSRLMSARPINILTRLQRRWLDKEPPSFCILDTEPPADHFAVSGDNLPSLSAAFLRRINKEHNVLSSSLPAREIYVRTYESRLDLMRCLIVGPLGTPYEHAPFVIDLALGPNFPMEPPKAHFHSWTGGLGRINPNLYEEGKICLSLLNTWPGQSEGETWSQKASILQVLISLMGLVLVKQPFYNEAGFETYNDEKLYTLESQQYSEKAFVIARGFIKHALKSPPTGLEDVLAYLYLPPMASFQANPKHTASQMMFPLNSDASIDQYESWKLTSPYLSTLPPPSLYRDPGIKFAENSLDFGASMTDQGDSLVISRGLLYTAIGRGRSIIERSAVTHDGEDGLVDGAGRSGDDTKVFLKPLSQGALVMLRKTLNSLIELSKMFVEDGAMDAAELEQSELT